MKWSDAHFCGVSCHKRIRGALRFHRLDTVLVWVSVIAETWTNSAKECTSLLSGNSTELYYCNTVRWTNQYYSPSVVLLVGSSDL